MSLHSHMGTERNSGSCYLKRRGPSFYGNFYAVEGGYGDEALHDFTGAPVDTFECSGEEQTDDEKWE